jgi:hypothetical protein
MMKEAIRDLLDNFDWLAAIWTVAFCLAVILFVIGAVFGFSGKIVLWLLCWIVATLCASVAVGIGGDF